MERKNSGSGRHDGSGGAFLEKGKHHFEKYLTQAKGEEGFAFNIGIPSAVTGSKMETGGSHEVAEISRNFACEDIKFSVTIPSLSGAPSKEPPKSYPQ